MSHLEALPLPFTTERLLLRRATVDDVEVDFTWRGLPEVYEWLPSAPRDVTEWRERFGSRESLDVTLMVCLHDGTPIGDLMVQLRDAWAQKEAPDQAKEAVLGWSLHPSYSGQGLASEAVATLMTLAFEHLGVRRVVAECFTDNERSWRLMERLGMRRESHAIEDSLHRSRGWLDGYTYALLHEEHQRGRLR